MKVSYKTERGQLGALQEAKAAAAAAVDEARESLVREFNLWCVETYGDAAFGVEKTSYSAPAAVPVVEAQEVMDDDEQFERIQEGLIMERAPESLAFERARKSVKGKIRPRR